MTQNLICKLLNTSSFKLRLNEALPEFSLVSEMFIQNKIPFVTWNPKGDKSLEIFEMGFTASCKFQDIYLLAFLLKDFGLEKIYPSIRLEPQISLGTYLHLGNKMLKYALAEPISIDSFLLFDPKINTQTAIDNFVENHFKFKGIEEDSEPTNTYFNNEDDDNYDNHNYDKDTFYAMTDGQLGSWDDFQGDIDDVFTWAGRD